MLKGNINPKFFAKTIPKKLYLVPIYIASSKSSVKIYH